MNNISTITTKGQATIPYFIRKKLDANIGDKLYFDDILLGSDRFIVKLIKKTTVDDLAGALKKPGQKYISIETARNKAMPLNKGTWI